MTFRLERAGPGRWPLLGMLTLVLVVNYLAWLGWRRDEDPLTYQVVGAAATAALITTVASWFSLRPRRTANIAFWSLFLVNAADMGLRGGENLWFASALFLGPFVWLALWLPAVGIEERQTRRSPVVLCTPFGPSLPTVVSDTNAQIAAWRAYRRTLDHR